MWKLTNEKDGKRTYTNSATGSKCITEKLYTDKEGNDWYGFTDLLAMPETRRFHAMKVSSLYALGLSRVDLETHINAGKAILKSSDPEKYEKLYANFLDFESKANNATDAIKQMTGLTCVYFLISDELIDAFDGSLQLRKMSILESDINAQSFFLSRQIELTESYTNHLNLISQIVLPQQSGK